ncbi:MAG: DNA primase [Patescibacteria group bacterium]|nr:DNA primase [Patescibacteria group bacterium]
MSSTPVELIKEKLDIVEFLKGYLQLQPAGKNFKARCPFHKEKTPSFMVSPDRQSWHCFGCALGGDAFSFIMRYENVEFGEALRVLAEKAGVELKRVNPSEYKMTGSLYDINAHARDFYRTQLAATEVARKYLEERGLLPETVEAFEIGWAPLGPEALTLHLINVGRYSPDEIIQAGLAMRTERGLVIDRFRGRIMFPIHNHFGKVAGFTGRVLPRPESSVGTDMASSSGAEIAKYVNTPETPVFQKSKLLYGFWRAKNAIREVKSVFIVEGQMDCIMSAQAGIPNVVASSGTAFTGDHLKTLRRVADEIVFSFDNDDAGLAAGERAIDLAQAEDFHVKVAMLKGVKDPAEFAVADPEGLKSAVVNATPAPLFYFEKYLGGISDIASPEQDFAQAGFSTREGLSRLRSVLGKIRAITSPVLRDFWFKELSRRTALGEAVLREEADRSGGDAVLSKETSSVTAEVAVVRRTRSDLLSEKILSYSVACADFSLAETCSAYFSPLYRRAFELLREGKKSSDDPEMDGVFNTVFLREDVLSDEDARMVKAEIIKEYSRKRKDELVKAVRFSEAKGDEKATEAALNELREISRNAEEV